MSRETSGIEDTHDRTTLGHNSLHALCYSLGVEWRAIVPLGTDGGGISLELPSCHVAYRVHGALGSRNQRHGVLVRFSSYSKRAFTKALLTDSANLVIKR